MAEDEVLVRMMVTDALTTAGFVVIEAGHAEGALMILHSQADQVRALFTDVHMPGAMNGLELVHHARLHWPWVGLMVASGIAHPTTTELPSGCRFLPKPYDPEHAVSHIRELVAAA